MGMFGNAMGAMVGAGGGGNAGPMNRRPGMPVQGQNPGMIGQNQNAMSGARTAQMRNPMNPGMMGPSQGMQQKMMPQAGLPYGQSNQMGGGMGQSYQPNGPKPTGGFMPPPQQPRPFTPGGNSGINGGNMGKYGPIVRSQMGGATDNMPQVRDNYAPMMNQGPQPMPMNNGEAPEEVPGAEEQMNPQMQNLMSQYGGRGPMNSPMSDPRMRNFGGPMMNRAPNM